tara:strand:- start:2662 stop:3222 length:561 start_codon:yes stop_codon:yes gene_type:complete
VKIDSESGLIPSVPYTCSPNQNKRPDINDISLVVIHGISLPPGQFGGSGIRELFTNTLCPTEHPYYASIAELQVSAHLVIYRDGSIEQFVPFHQRAWHAGLSSYNGRDKCNDFAVGIELEGTDDTPYSQEQYNTLADVIVALVEAYPELTYQKIVGHCDIAPGRKTDPGPAFDWSYLQALIVKADN